MDIAQGTVAGGGATAQPEPASEEKRAFRGSTADRRSGVPSRPPRPTFSGFIDDVRAAFTARFQLFELEAKRAALSVAYMLGCAVAAALLGVTAWLILIGSLIVAAVIAGVPWVLAVVVAIALHAVAAFLLVRAIRGFVSNLTFEGTRSALARSNSAKDRNDSGA
ncbi:MAG: phage holin family protein [Burkholderiaceae bacterium]